MGESLFGKLRAMWSHVDPPPALLVDLTCFALESTTASTEVLRPGARELVGARGDERARLVTFDGDSLTVMVDILVQADDTVRVDGWLTPPANHRVELRLATGDVHVTTADDGRFAFDRVPRGLAQFLVHANGSVSTPSIVL